MKPKIKLALVGPALNTAVFDHNDQQIAELQVSLPELFAAHLERLGYDPTGFPIASPHFTFEIFKTSEGKWNYNVSHK